MIKNKNIGIISFISLFLSTLIIMGLFMNSSVINALKSKNTGPEYLNKLFDDSYVHSIDIQIDSQIWKKLLENAIEEEYFLCNIIVDGEKFNNVGIRAKGNSSLSQVVKSESDRYSFKIEFNHFNETNLYYGLDKLVLNNLISDTSYMKEYFVYDMMKFIGAKTPYSSFISITINGEPWGLYLGVEGIDHSFLTRNYGNKYGELYKPEPLLLHSKIKKSKYNTDADLVYINDDFNNYELLLDSSRTDATSLDKRRLINSLKILNTGQNLENVIDIENTLKYWVVHNFACSYDSYTGGIAHNYYLYEENGQMTMFPWDYNLSFGGFAMGTKWQGNTDLDSTTILINTGIDSPLNNVKENKRPFWSKLIQNKVYKEMYHDYFESFINDYFKSGYFQDKIMKTYSLIFPYVENDKSAFCTFEQFNVAVETLREVLILRSKSIIKQLNGEISIDGSDFQNYIDGSHLELIHLSADKETKYPQKEMVIEKNEIFTELIH